jgi:spore germination protein GerM
VSLLSDHVTFFATKQNKKEINGCHFKVTVAENEDVKKLGIEVNGYLNRIGKKNLVVSCIILRINH